ncbi:MAG: TIM barrel protein [Anaerolineae bacterium]|nr:TIM barrel protein [Anaerolineae bacterium]
MAITIGTAPDSWGVWFPADAKQTPWERFLDEVVEAGYEWIELGPVGYLPTDLTVLRRELDKRGLKVSGTFVMDHLENPDRWPQIEKQTRDTSSLLANLNAKFLVVIDDVYSDLFTGKRTLSPTLDEGAWNCLCDTVNRIGALAQEYGLQAVFHPHAETHVEYEPQIEKFLQQTDPALVGICLETGHQAYRGGDPVGFIRRHPDRVPYMHLKNVDPVKQKQVEAEDIPFAIAVAQDMFCEPSKGVVDFVALRDVLNELNFNGWGIVEQDMYPAPFDKPLPIAKRTRAYLREIGMG